MGKDEPKFVQDTLDWCNKMRKERGKRPLKKLPKGKQGDALSCPCGAATGLKVFTSYATDPGKIGVVPYYEASMKLPASVRTFVEYFDKGLLPQYIKKEK